MSNGPAQQIGGDNYVWVDDVGTGSMLFLVATPVTLNGRVLCKVAWVAARPDNYADVQYVLAIDQTSGLPAWRILTDATVGTGFGMAFGASFGH